MFRIALLLLSIMVTVSAGAQEPKPPVHTPEENELAETANKRIAEASRAYHARRFDEAEAGFRETLKIRQKLYPKAKYPDGHHDLAVSLNNLAMVLKTMGQAGQALDYFSQSLEMFQKL